MKNNSIKKLLSLVFSIILLVPCTAADISSDEETIEEPGAPVIAKPSVPRPSETSLTTKIPADPIAQPMSATPQQKLEQDILATMQELKSVAQELSAFTKSPEAQKIRDEKKKKRDEIEKRAEQQRKARLERASHWRPSTSSYGPSYSPSRWGGDAWDRSSRGDRGWTPSSDTPSWTGEAPSKLTTPEELKQDTTLSGKSGDKITTDEGKNRRGGKTIAGDQEKGIFSTYNKTAGIAKQVANKLQAALGGLDDKKDLDAAKELLHRKSLTGISGQLDALSSTYETLKAMLPSEDALKNIDQQHGDLLSKEFKKIETLLGGAFKHLLLAATLQKDEGLHGKRMTSLQPEAQSILLSEHMRKYVNEQIVNDRANVLWGIIEQEYTQNKTALQTRGADGAALAAQLENIETRIDNLIEQFPIPPTVLTKQLKKIQDDIQTAKGLQTRKAAAKVPVPVGAGVIRKAAVGAGGNN